jgi:hypothetical protein
LLVIPKEQLKVDTNDLPSVAKKVVAMSVSSTETFSMIVALQLEVPTMAAASIPGRKVGECWKSGLDGRLEAVVASIHLEARAASIQLEEVVAATSEAAQLWETPPPTPSLVLEPYENLVT